MLVKLDVKVLGILCGKPMNCSLYLSSVGGISVSCLKITSTTYFFYASVLVLDDLIALDYICAHKTNLPVGLESEELGRRNLSEVIGIYIKLTGKRNFSCSAFGILGIVGQ